MSEEIPNLLRRMTLNLFIIGFNNVIWKKKRTVAGKFWPFFRFHTFPRSTTYLSVDLSATNTTSLCMPILISKRV